MKKSNLVSYAITILVAIGLSIFIHKFVVQLMVVEGESMLNTIDPGEKVVSFKLAEPEKGDIIIVEDDENRLLIKRLIGKEGDKLKIEDNDLYLNGEKQKEEYIKEPMKTPDMGPIDLKEDELFVMGDNRNNSYDSRFYGKFTMDDYRGKVVFRF